jgi:hypothetical protein
MRFEILLILIAGAIMANIYTEGKYLKKIILYKKYYQMAGIAFGAFVLYYMVRKNPLSTQQLLVNSNEYIKYLPIDKSTTDMLSPILDFTSKYGAESDGDRPILQMGGNGGRKPNPLDPKIMQSGKEIATTKRSVSETKKKFVASRQNWICETCNSMLNYTFEVDHKIALENGGSNHVDNLVALCRECHGKKTALDRMNKSAI